MHDAVVSLEELREEVSAVISPLAATRGLSFSLNFDDAPAELTTDPGKLRQVLLNLLGNAVKFTPTGGVTLTVAESAESIVFTVEDTGPGIRAADRERIFEAFTQLDETATRSLGGTGLGFAITSRLVALLAGTVRVDAREESGSSFVVTLPARRDPT